MSRRLHQKPRTLCSLSLLGLAGLGLVCLTPATAHAIDPFVDGTAALGNPNLTSGVAIGVADMNSDGLDDLVRLHDARFLEIEYQQGDGSFVRYSAANTGGSMWSMSIGDVDANGYPDVFTSGAYNGLRVYRANANGTSLSLTTPTAPNTFTQCSNFVDIDNNGTLDLFVCHDDGLSRPMNNNGTGTFTHDTGLINPVSSPASDNSGNYGTVWTDYDNDGDIDLYIAKCRLGVNNPSDGRRTNVLYENDGSGNYSEVANSVGLRPLGQSWVMDFADIDNDGDFDAFLSNHDISNVFYENGAGADAVGDFTNITASATTVADMNAADFVLQAHFEDFDNDTYVDLLLSGSFGSQHRLLMNDGDGTFTNAGAALPNNRQIHSFAIGDLNNDGFPDINASYGSGYNEPSSVPDVLLLNAGNANNYFNVRLHGTTSNATAVGARVEINGAWGMQTREVRAGESYGITNTAMQHFGLGTSTAIDSVVIHWPSGLDQTIDDPEINQVLDVTEGCATPFYADTDNDGAGDPDSVALDCEAPKGYVEDNTDCDDDDGDNFPDNPEVCDGSDNNCDDAVDEGLDDCAPGTSSSGGSSETGDDSTTGGGESTTGGATTTPVSSTAASDSSDETDGGTSTTGGATQTGGASAGTTAASMTGSVDSGTSDGEETDGDTDAGENSDDSGCSCQGGGSPAGALWLVPFGLLLRRRRR